MTIEKVSYAGSPEKVTEEAFDCVWVYFANRKTPTPLSNPLLQWLDWRLQGQLSRFVLAGRELQGKTTFVPTQKKLASPWVALEPPGATDWKLFSENCEGMGIRRLLVLCEDAEQAGELEKDLRKSASGMERVVLGSDGPVGRA